MAKKTNAPQTVPAQKELITVMILSLILGLGGGYLIGNAVAGTNTTPATSKPVMQHGHDIFNVPIDQAPTVQLEVTEDAKSGYNVRIVTSNFTFAPESVNQENVIGEGHAHLYVDGEKIGRIYSEYTHYDGNFEGTKTFRVTLNSNDHSEYAVDGQTIQASVDVTHDSSDPNHDAMHSMDSMNKPE